MSLMAMAIMASSMVSSKPKGCYSNSLPIPPIHTFSHLEPYTSRGIKAMTMIDIKVQIDDLCRNPLYCQNRYLYLQGKAHQVYY